MSENRELSQTFKEAYCPICGKEFLPHEDWGYKRYVKGRQQRFCSWHCLRASEKQDKSAAERRADIIQAIRDGLNDKEIAKVTGEDMSKILYWRRKEKEVR
jgi:DNA-binding NarL/FixJ family response regulator